MKLKKTVSEQFWNSFETVSFQLKQNVPADTAVAARDFGFYVTLKCQIPS